MKDDKYDCVIKLPGQESDVGFISDAAHIPPIYVNSISSCENAFINFGSSTPFGR